MNVFTTHAAESVNFEYYASADLANIGASSYFNAGFRPKGVIINAVLLNGTAESRGMYAQNNSQSTLYRQQGGTFTAISTGAIRLEVDAANYIVGAITVDDTGFTINWTKTGSPTGYILFNFIAMTH